MKDSHGRTIDYLRISLTDRCNLRCIYCMPPEGVECLSHGDILRFDEIVDVVKVAAEMGITRLRLTGGEPLVRKGVVELVRELRAIPGIESIAMTTNGIAFPKMAHALHEAGLSRVNISLDTLDAAQYSEITRGGDMAQAMAGIDAALAEGFSPVKVNAVAVRSLHQDFYGFAKMTVDRPIHIRFIEYMPVGDSAGIDGCGWGPQDVIDCEEIRDIIDNQAVADGLGKMIPARKHKPQGWGPAQYYEFENAQGTVGFISPMSRHFCSECNRLRLTAEGGLRPCLFSDQEFDVRTALAEEGIEGVRRTMKAVLGAKPDEHHEGEHANATTTNMNQIGG